MVGHGTLNPRMKVRFLPSQPKITNNIHDYQTKKWILCAFGKNQKKFGRVLQNPLGSGKTIPLS